MSKKLDVVLSPELEKYRLKIEATIQPYVEIAIENDNQPSWWQSKFGSLPYLPKGYNYPKTPNDEYLYLLAQINFAEVPLLSGFPNKGILQFYIANDDLYGCDFNNQTLQTGFKVLYFPEPDLNIDNIITDFDFLGDGSLYLPIHGCCSLKFTKKYAPITNNDYKLIKHLGKDFDNLLLYDNKINEEYSNLSAAVGHKIGGYPNFTQSDPREHLARQGAEQYILLFQMDSDANGVIDIMWGDVGIANFFIKESALSQLDFSDVLYNWDCG